MMATDAVLLLNGCCVAVAATSTHLLVAAAVILLPTLRRRTLRASDRLSDDDMNRYKIGFVAECTNGSRKKRTLSA
jgi:hypothetical protein